jgi:Pectate lyase superfamily protein
VATVVGMTADAINAALGAIDTTLSNKADLVGGVVPDNQAPNITVKKDTFVINAKDHGAVGDGVTPDDAALIAGIAAVNITVFGGKLYLPPGQYLLNGSTALALANAGLIIEGAGAQATQIVIGAGFTAAQAISITAKNCQVKNLTIIGHSTTTTSNPVSGGVKVSGARRARITDCEFWYLNGWAIENIASVTDPNGNHEATISRLDIRQCAAGIHLVGNNTSGYASNSLLSDIRIMQGGVTTGASANLDNIRIEDSWDILLSNVMSWTYAGSGIPLHVLGNCGTIVVKSLDAEGTYLAPCVVLEDGTNGSVQNVQIMGGIVQQGTIGVQAKGSSSYITLFGLRVVNSLTHGVSIESGQPSVVISALTFANSGMGAAGTNYDLNWSGSATGIVDGCRFSTALVATGTVGVQSTVNIGSGQNVRFENVYFTGSGSTTSNQFTNLPSAVLTTNLGAYSFLTSTSFKNGLTNQSIVGHQPASSANTVMSSNTGGNSANDSWRMDGNGGITYGPGGASARDTTWSRQGVAQIGTPDSDLVIGLAGKGLRVKSGTNARIGTATLAAGTVTVANTSVTANTVILLGGNAPVTANAGALFVSSVTPGTGFTVKSTNASDTSKFGYQLVESI